MDIITTENTDNFFCSFTVRKRWLKSGSLEGKEISMEMETQNFFFQKGPDYIISQHFPVYFYFICESTFIAVGSDRAMVVGGYRYYVSYLRYTNSVR